MPRHCHLRSIRKNKIREGFEFLYNWNGFEDLIPAFVREGGETVERMRKLADEGSYDYNAGADELERSIKKWDASLS